MAMVYLALQGTFVEVSHPRLLKMQICCWISGTFLKLLSSLVKIGHRD